MTGFRALYAAILIALLAAPASVPAWSQDAFGAAQRASVIGTIRAQMDAFIRDDGAAAFSHAAPVIQRLFQTPDTFMAMVRGGYAPVYRPREVEFLAPRADGEDILQPVRVTGPDGESVIAMYRMQRQGDGTWKIAGVVLLRTGERSS